MCPTGLNSFVRCFVCTLLYVTLVRGQQQPTIDIQRCYSTSNNTAASLCLSTDGSSMSWPHARARCSLQNGWRLVSVANIGQQNALQQFLSDGSVRQILQNSSTSVWIDGTTTPLTDYHWIDGRQVAGSFEAVNQDDLGSRRFAAICNFVGYGGRLAFCAQDWSNASPFICQTRDPVCDNGWLRSSICYRTYEAALNWYVASNECLLKGGLLATFSDLAKPYLDNIIVAQLNATTRTYWIGLVRPWFVRTDEGGNMVDTIFTQWQIGSPPAAPLTNVNLCVAAQLNGYWTTNSNCYQTLPFICEVPQSAITQPPATVTQRCYSINSTATLCLSSDLTKASWTNAKSACSRNSLKLASIGRAVEENALQQFLADDNIAPAIRDSAIWIDGTTEQLQTDFHWITGRPVVGNFEVVNQDDDGARRFAAVCIYSGYRNQLAFCAQEWTNTNSFVCQFSDPVCENGWLRSSICYRTYEAALNWYAASNECLLKGGLLATFSDLAKPYLDNIIVAQLNATTRTYWIGLVRPWFVRTDEGKNIIDVIFTYWQTGSPPNSPSANVILCLAAYFNGTWTTGYTCDQTLIYVCEERRIHDPFNITTGQGQEHQTYITDASTLKSEQQTLQAISDTRSPIQFEQQSTQMIWETMVITNASTPSSTYAVSTETSSTSTMPVSTEKSSTSTMRMTTVAKSVDRVTLIKRRNGSSVVRIHPHWLLSSSFIAYLIIFFGVL